MGIGSYGICNDTQEAVCIDMLEYTGAYEDDDIEIQDYDYDDVIAEIEAALSPAFSMRERQYDGEHRIIAESRILSVQVIGHEHDLGLRVKVRGDVDINGINTCAMQASARRLFNRLSDVLPLRVKTSGYTSAPYTKQ